MGHFFLELGFLLSFAASHLSIPESSLLVLTYANPLEPFALFIDELSLKSCPITGLGSGSPFWLCHTGLVSVDVAMLQPAPPAPFGTAALSANAGLAFENSIRERTDETNDDRITSPTGDKAESSDTSWENGISKDDPKIAALARKFSHEVGDGINTFLNPNENPELDPHSDQFNSRKWTKNLLQVTSRDPERYPRRTAGVSFRNLSAFGYGTAADYQADVGNMWLKGVGWLRGLLGWRNKVRIDILRNFEGYVRNGEMLVVLGRPGR